MANLAREYECGEATIWRALHSVGGLSTARPRRREAVDWPVP
jgi:hypothetical protein